MNAVIQIALLRYVMGFPRGGGGRAMPLGPLFITLMNSANLF